MTEPGDGLAEEVARLLVAAQEWWDERVGTGGSDTGPECRVCPLCQLLATLRAARPDAFAHLADANASLVLALRAVADAAPKSPSPRRSEPPLQRIDLG